VCWLMVILRHVCNFAYDKVFNNALLIYLLKSRTTAVGEHSSDSLTNLGS